MSYQTFDSKINGRLRPEDSTGKLVVIDMVTNNHSISYLLFSSTVIRKTQVSNPTLADRFELINVNCESKENSESYLAN